MKAPPARVWLMSGRLYVRKTDPRVRKDGKCAVCLGPRNPERSTKYGREQATTDPFCSRICAESYHNIDPKSLGASG